MSTRLEERTYNVRCRRIHFIRHSLVASFCRIVDRMLNIEYLYVVYAMM